MKNIPLSVLDEYAMRLSDTQVSKLYEHKMNKEYAKPLYEKADANLYKLYLNAYTIAYELEKGKSEFLMNMNNKYPSLMESVSYKVNSDSITFSTRNKQSYSDLLQCLHKEGFDFSLLEELIDEKY